MQCSYTRCLCKCLTLHNNFQEIEKYKLGDPKTFHYLNQSNCYQLVGINEAQDYLATRRAMDIVGISDTDQVIGSSCYIFL